MDSTVIILLIVMVFCVSAISSSIAGGYYYSTTLTEEEKPSSNREKVDKWTVFYSTTDSSKNLSEAVVNSKFALTKILRRKCVDCVDSHKEIYYKRITPIPEGFSIYNSMINTWGSADNVLNTDFKLFSTYSDLKSDTNSWAFCNYDDIGIGAFRDCGVTSNQDGQWNSTSRGGKEVTYEVLERI